MGKNQLRSLKQIHQSYELSVWDNCPLIGFLPFGSRRGVKDGEKFASYLIDKIQEYDCFIPESVKAEYIKGIEIGIGDCTNQERLIKKIEEIGRILYPNKSRESLNSSECDKYCAEFEKRFHMHKTDLRVFSWAIKLQKLKRTPIAIISNDLRGIGEFWEKLIGYNLIDSRELGFFPRRDLDWYGGY